LGTLQRQEIEHGLSAERKEKSEPHRGSQTLLLANLILEMIMTGVYQALPQNESLEKRLDNLEDVIKLITIKKN